MDNSKSYSGKSPGAQYGKESFEIKIMKGKKMICKSNIIYVKAGRKLSIVQTNDGNEILAFHQLNWFEQHLFPTCFFRCHNSFIVSCRFIRCYNNVEIFTESNSVIPLARCKRDGFRKNYAKYLETVKEKKDLKP